MQTSDILRGAYDRASKIFSGFMISRQNLRVEQLLNANRSQYTFNLKQGNSTTDGPLERRLSDNDAFVFVALMIGVKKQNATAPLNPGNYPIFTYPDEGYFIGTPAGAATEVAALYSLYNGTVALQTGSLERIKPTPLYDCLYSPERVTTAADTVVTPQYSGYDMRNQGYMEMQPTLLLDGKQNNDLVVNLGEGSFTAIDGSWDGAAQTATTRNVLVVQALGLLIHNGAQEFKRYAEQWNESVPR